MSAAIKRNYFFYKIKFEISFRLFSLEALCMKWLSYFQAKKLPICLLLFTFKMSLINVTDNILRYLFYFSKKIKLDISVTKTCLYNVDRLKPHFYIIKLGLTGVYIMFHISAQNIDCGYSLEPPQRGGSNEYPQSMFVSWHKKNIRIFIWNYSYFAGKFSNIFE